MERENCYLNPDQLNVLTNILLSEQEKLKFKDKDHENFCLEKEDLADVLDEANANIQASQELRFRNREIFYFRKIKQSLDSIQRGTYGLCENCGNEITFERLRARPTAALCISCKEESEMAERSNIHQRKSKSQGKTLQEYR